MQEQKPVSAQVDATGAATTQVDDERQRNLSKAERELRQLENFYAVLVSLVTIVISGLSLCLLYQVKDADPETYRAHSLGHGIVGLISLLWLWSPILFHFVHDRFFPQLAQLRSTSKELARLYTRMQWLGASGLVFTIFGVTLGAYYPGFLAGLLLPVGLGLLWMAQRSRSLYRRFSTLIEPVPA
jgi:hypothetical protein